MREEKRGRREEGGVLPLVSGRCGFSPWRWLVTGPGFGRTNDCAARRVSVCAACVGACALCVLMTDFPANYTVNFFQEERARHRSQPGGLHPPTGTICACAAAPHAHTACVEIAEMKEKEEGQRRMRIPQPVYCAGGREGREQVLASGTRVRRRRARAPSVCLCDTRSRRARMSPFLLPDVLGCQITSLALILICLPLPSSLLPFRSFPRP